MAGSTILSSFRKGVVVSLALGVVVYVGYALFTGWEDTAGALASFRWSLLPVLLAMSLANYGIRFVRWEMYLRMLDIRIPLKTSASIFLAGLAMTITPGKIGEFLKSYLLREIHGVAMATSAPIVFAERVGDLLALVLLASFGVAAFGGAGALPVLIVAGGGVLAGVVVLQSRTLTDLVLGLVEKVPVGNKIAPKIREAVDSSRALLAWKPLVAGLALGTVAWLFECAEYGLAFSGFDGPGVSYSVALFGYSFSTVAGIVSPGGLGPTDVGLIEIASRFTDGLSHETATAAAFIVRFCTLWFAVILGAIALLRFGTILDVDVEVARGAAPKDPHDAD
jgi:uncharacterized protein (TIRG00374 family)